MNTINMQNMKLGYLIGKRIFLLSAAYLMLFQIGCKTSTHEDGSATAETKVSKTLEPLYNHILAVHDEVMPDMQNLTNLQGQMRSVLDTLRAQTPIDNTALSEANRILGGLNRAENAMWNWMHHFAKLDSIPEGDKERFLLTEKTSVETMKELVQESMQIAQKYLETLLQTKDEI